MMKRDSLLSRRMMLSGILLAMLLPASLVAVWFDEFDFGLGQATTNPPGTAWKKGLWRRDFVQGIAVVNPTKEAVTTTLEPGLSRLCGQQAPDVNNGETVTTLTLNSRDGIILRKRTQP